MSLINEVVTIATIMGEIVGRLKENTDSVYTLEHPRMFVQTAEGAGYAPGITMTGDQGHDLKEVSFNKSLVLAMTKTNENAKKAWIQSTSGLIL